MIINLVDNDIVLKISQYGLVDEFVEVTGGFETIYILPTLKYRFFLNDDSKALKYAKSTEALDLLRDFVKRSNEINDEAPEELLTKFSDIDQIDPGEAILFALNVVNEDSLTLTGDKRSLIAIARFCKEENLTDSLTGRLKCLEQITAEMLVSCNSSEVIRKVKGQQWDNSLRACFPLHSSDKENILAGLKSYYDHLNRECSGMLAPFPV